jgi:hypothetical protein
MLDRAAIERVQMGVGEGVEKVGPEQADAVLVEAVAVSSLSHDPAVRAALQALRDHDPSLKVRDAARSALGPSP